MITVTVTGYQQTCATNSGGISRLWVGDASDFDFTSGTTSAEESGYSAIARRAGATAPDGSLFEIILQDETGKATITQSIENGSASWAYLLEGQLLRVQQSMAKFAAMLDSASICGQLLWVWSDMNGKIWVAGEQYVDATQLSRKFKLKQNGSVIDWGQAMNSFNGMNLKVAGNYYRPAYEFTGGIAGITAVAA
jgi:hypothetical protein